MIQVEKLLTTLQGINNLEDLEKFNQEVFGKSGVISEEFKKMKEMSVEEKKQFGQEISNAKETLTQAYDQKEQEISVREINKKLNEDLVDISLETTQEKGHFSILAKVRREMEEICRSMGFIVEYGNEVVTKFENFESVNLPLSHPATEMHDTIYLNEKDNEGESLILRTQTSSMQNFLIKKYGLPIRAVVPGKVYRYENIDATHDTMFYQLEGLYVDKNVSIANFKDMMEKLLSAILHKEVEIRMRPGFFPFVEPGFEIDARYKMFNKKTGKEETSKWMEILGAGMVHPNVLKAAGLDPQEWTGFAFGIGINRVAAIRYGIKDIRLFTNGDLRFAKSF